MEQLKKFLESYNELSNGEILEVFNLIGKNGDVILLKNDGLRDTNKFTVVIMRFGESIRYDDETLSDALKRALDEYVNLID